MERIELIEQLGNMKNILEGREFQSIVEDNYLTRENIYKYLCGGKIDNAEPFDMSGYYKASLFCNENPNLCRSYKFSRDGGVSDFLLLERNLGDVLPYYIAVGREVVHEDDRHSVCLISQHFANLRTLNVYRIPDVNNFLCKVSQTIEKSQIIVYPDTVIINGQRNGNITDNVMRTIDFSLEGRNEISEDFQKVIGH